MQDIIVYQIVPNPDAEGLSTDDKGRAVIDKKAAHDFVGKDPRYSVIPVVVDPQVIRDQALSRLSPIEQLFFTFEVPRQHSLR